MDPIKEIYLGGTRIDSGTIIPMDAAEMADKEIKKVNVTIRLGILACCLIMKYLIIILVAGIPNGQHHDSDTRLWRF